jgi:outer membrane protein TolC
LSYLTGIDVAEFKVIDEMPETENFAQLDKFLSDASRRPDIEAARKEVEFQQYRVKAVRGQLLPTLNFTGSWYVLNGTLPDSSWSTLLALNVPLFQGGIAKGQENEQISRLRGSQDQLSQLNKDVTTAIRQLYRAIESSIKQMAAYKDAYEKSEKSYQMQIRDYRYGLVNNLDVIQSISSLLDVKRNLDRSIIQVKVNKILLKIATEN